jgi:hypothetical protein
MRDTGSMFRCKNGHVYPKRNGRICPYCGLSVELDSSVSNSPRSASDIESMLLFEKVEPVCGWLACVEGAFVGMSFTLHSGKNFIGRSDDMDVRLPGDDSVARRNHAIIAYDTKSRRFTLLPGDSEGMLYLDGSAVFEPKPLNDMSLLQLGRTKLIFRPLCGEFFDWEWEGV